jgi:hypothetical protein
MPEEIDEKQRAICQSKDPYDTKEDADKAIKRLREQFAAPPLFVYECPVCGLYHFTKKLPEERN